LGRPIFAPRCLQRLDSYGVKFHSYTEAHLNTDSELVRNVLLAVYPGQNMVRIIPIL